MAERIISTGTCSALFAACALGFGGLTAHFIAETFHAAASQPAATGDVVAGTILSLTGLGATAMVAACAGWMAKLTFRPEH